MYYHNSPTVQQLRQLKRAKADEMKFYLHAMTRVTTKYDNAIYLLQRLRTKELEIENEMSTGRLEGDDLIKEQKNIEFVRRKTTKIVEGLLHE